jgi:hypothetical protein
VITSNAEALAREWLALMAWTASGGVGEQPPIPLLSALPGPDGVGEHLARHVLRLTAERDGWKAKWAAVVADGYVILGDRDSYRDKYVLELARAETLQAELDRLTSVSQRDTHEDE